MQQLAASMDPRTPPPEDNEVAEPMDRSLFAGDEVGGVGPGVVVDRIGEVVGEVLDCEEDNQLRSSYWKGKLKPPK